MDRQLRRWILSCSMLGAVFIGAALHLGGASSLPPWEREGLTLLRNAGIGLLAVVAAALWQRGRLGRALADGSELGPAVAHPRTSLFWISFAALFIEVMLIRYCNSQLRIFAFYKNVPLIASFVGLGLGCCLGGGRPRHVLLFLLWLVPFALFLATGAGAIDGYLGRWAAVGSSEHLLGDVVVKTSTAQEAVWSQLYVGVFCVATFVAVTGLFTLLGRLLGEAFEHVSRLPAYTLNILGSLLGILVFVALCTLETPPWSWFACGLVPLACALTRGLQRKVALAFAVASVVGVVAVLGGTIWSRYQKLVVIEIPPGTGISSTDSPAFLILISDVFYQVAMDLRPENVAALGANPFPHYAAMFEALGKRPERVLVVGAGSGNDVAAALRAGASHVDAVDIDPAIVDVGRRLHPEHPYSDPRVSILIDDARAAFRSLPTGSYDAVVFGLLDSHTQLGMSSVRLDNYVFTLESLDAARRLLKPGGHLIIAAATYREWFRTRFEAMMNATCDGGVRVFQAGSWFTFIGKVNDPSAPPADLSANTRASLPTDDWPFLYLPARGVPRAYLVVVGMLLLASVFVLERGGMKFASFAPEHAHFFFLGAAFLLMEVSAINRLALLFGTTWLVSAVTIALVLVLIMAANATVALAGQLPYALSYVLLLVTLLVSYGIDPAWALGKGGVWAVGYGLMLLSPIYWAGTIFARSFVGTRRAGAAMGFNILGSALGGWLEYATMATGIRSLVLVALALYALSLLVLIASRRAPSIAARGNAA